MGELNINSSAPIAALVSQGEIKQTGWFQANVKDPVKQLLQKAKQKELEKDITGVSDLADHTNGTLSGIVNAIPIDRRNSIIYKLVNLLPDKAKSVAMKVQVAARDFFLSEGFKDFLVYSGMAVGVAAVGFAAKEVYENVKGAIQAKKDRDRESFYDHVMDTAKETGKVINGVTGVLLSAASKGLIAMSYVAWIPVVTVVSGVLGIVGVVKYGVNFGQSIAKYREFKKIIVNDQDVDEKFENATVFISDMKAKHVAKYFGKNKETLINTLDRINTTEERGEALKFLKGRVKAVTINNGTGLGVGVANVVANVLIFIPATAGAAVFVYLGTSAISLAKDGYNWDNRHKFNKGMEKLARDSEIKENEEEDRLYREYFDDDNGKKELQSKPVALSIQEPGDPIAQSFLEPDEEKGEDYKPEPKPRRNRFVMKERIVVREKGLVNETYKTKDSEPKKNESEPKVNVFVPDVNILNNTKNSLKNVENKRPSVSFAHS